MKLQNNSRMMRVPENFTFVAASRQGIRLAFPEPSLYGSNIQQSVTAQGDGDAGFTREQFFAALEASAVELGEGLDRLESNLSQEERQGWLSAFDKPE